MRTLIITIIFLVIYTSITAQNCGMISTSCFEASIVDIINTDTETEYRMRLALEDDCLSNNAVSHVSFGLPEDISAISPSENGTYTSDHTGLDYDVENMSNNPFHSIKFNTAGDEGIKRGEDEIFVFTVPRLSNIEEILVEVKMGSESTIVEISVEESCMTPAALPVELTEFMGEDMTGDVSLIWATASEENSSHFEVERSNDGRDWTTIGEVESNHNSIEMNTYFFVDQKIDNEVNYYRLRMVDLDETFEYSDIITVIVEEFRTITEVEAYPNPTVNHIKIDINTTGEKKLNIDLVNTNGNIMNQSTVTADGENSQKMDMSEFAAGVYYLVVNDGVNTQTHKIVKESL